MKTIVIAFFIFVAVMILLELQDRKGESLQRKESKDSAKIEPKIAIPSSYTKKIKDIFIPPKPKVSLSEQLSLLGANIGDPIFIRIFKYSAELEVWIRADKQYELLQTYDVCSLSGYLGPKLKEGDLQAPEGFYFVTKSRLNPNSKYHLSFNLGYPNKYDRAHKRTGSALMVHGGCLSAGCFAMTDGKIEDIYELVEKALDSGQKIVRVHIFPFRMSESKMEYYRKKDMGELYDFWLNLKEGYDYFESNGVPPNTTVEQKKYIFE